MSEKKSTSGPVRRFRLGTIKGEIWKNETAKGSVRYNTNIFRLYKKDPTDKEWHKSTSFGRDELPRVAQIAHQAHAWIFEDMQAKPKSGEAE